ncbi:MAG: tRNA (adenosine(37)-N6)-threonylcarbamoyltransferase complex dimerization subunit type 1 TsaB [Deltaproteobacteria bacterium]
MKLLAVETSTSYGSVAVVEVIPRSEATRDPFKVLAEGTIYSQMSHSERLLPLIDLLLSQSGVDISEIDYFAASIGPGSFTGLRVGLSTMQAFAFAHQKKVVGVPTLEAMSLSGIFHEGPICSFLDAGRGELYAALYSVTSMGEATCLLPVSIQKPAALILKLKEFLGCHSEGVTPCHSEGEARGIPQTPLLIGDISLIEKEISHEKTFKWSSLLFSQPRASQVAQIAFNKIASGHAVDPDKLLPLYVRLPQAELSFRAQSARNPIEDSSVLRTSE